MNQEFTIYRGDGQHRAGAAAAIPNEPLVFREQGRYIADEELSDAVNIALCVGQPLLLTGEPGCGKTRLAWSIAHELELGEPLVFVTRSDSRATDLLYFYDAILRFHHIQTSHPQAADAARYIRYNALGAAIVSGERRVVLIDEIDKAPRDFPNDLLHELDRMSFEIPELGGELRRHAAGVRPIVVITSNSEHQLPVPFLRRCVFHHIEFPNREKLEQIVDERLRGLDLPKDLISSALGRFLEVREVHSLTKKPATGELLVWLSALKARQITAAALDEAPLWALPLSQALIKDLDDVRRLRDAIA